MGASVQGVIPLAAPDLTGNERKYLNECIDTGYVTHAGRFESAFEQAFSERFRVPALATSSGTGALHLALLSLGVGPGDEVIVPDLTFGATASVVCAVGATPVLVDVSPQTWGLDRNRVAAAINRRTRAILPVSLYGVDAGDYREFGVPVIEDACEGLGLVPIRGDMTCYSFYGNKCLTTGEGGMLCGDFGNARLWRNGGFDTAYRNVLPGLNYRMTNMQAALGLAQLERFGELLAKRMHNAARYAQLLKGKGRWLFVAEVTNPVQVQAELKKHGIDSRPVFTPLHLSPAFRQYAKGKYRVSEDVWQHGVCLPTGPHVSLQQVEKIAGLINGSRHLCQPANRDIERACAV